jgi:hypothetical protein
LFPACAAAHIPQSISGVYIDYFHYRYYDGFAAIQLVWGAMKLLSEEAA